MSSKLRPRPGTADDPVVVDQVPPAAQMIGQSPEGVAWHRAGCRGGYRWTTADCVLFIRQQLIDGGPGEVAISDPSWLSSLTVAVDEAKHLLSIGPGKDFVTTPVRHIASGVKLRADPFTGQLI